MGFMDTVRGLVTRFLGTKVEEEFHVRPIDSNYMANIIAKCADVYSGHPHWVSEDDEIKTINMAKTICSEIARLTVMGTRIKIDGGQMGKYLQKQIDRIYFRLRKWVEYGCAYGTIILKPNGKDVDVYFPNEFVITDVENDKVNGVAFRTKQRSTDGKKTYIRLEYHRWDDDLYVITNRAYVANGDADETHGTKISLAESPWADIEEEVTLQVEKPLFAVFTMPEANNADTNSALGLPVFYNSLTELRDLDVAYSRNATEVDDSKRIVLLDSDRLLPGKNITKDPKELAKGANKLRLPRFVRAILGTGDNDIYHEINPALNTNERLKQIDALLSQIGFKCGFSNGYFVFNQKTGMVTATQVESDDRRTLQSIKDVRDQLESCLDDLIYALSEFADLYDVVAPGEFETVYEFGDLIYSYEQDKATWWAYVLQGKMPAYRYFMKFEGMTEEEAKEIEAEVQPPVEQLFGAE